jgi:hypothetical protein
VEGGRERDDFFFKFCFFIVEWLGTGVKGFFKNMLKGDGREFFVFFSMLKRGVAINKYFFPNHVQ